MTEERIVVDCYHGCYSLCLLISAASIWESSSGISKSRPSTFFYFVGFAVIACICCINCY